MRDDRGSNRLLTALRDPETLATLSESEWKGVLARARDAGLLARLESVLVERNLLGQIPGKARVQLAEARTFVRRNQTDIRFELNRVARTLEKLEVPIILLKGAAYLMAELPPAGRHLAADLDIMVPKERLESAEQALRSAGWQGADLSQHDARYYREWMHEIPPLWHPDRLFAIDVHHTISPTTSRYRPNPEALIASAVQLDDGSLKVLCPADMVLHSAVHLFTEEFMLGLRQLADLHDLMNYFGRSEAFWDDLLERSRLHGLERILYYTLRYSSRLLDTGIPHETRRAIEAYRPNIVVRAIMDAAVTSALGSTALGESRFGRQVALWLLYVRSHWLKMPPLVLARHLLIKMVGRSRTKLGLPSAKTAANAN